MTAIGDIVVDNPNAIATLPGVTTSACFMTFRNGSNNSDWLTGAGPAPGAPFGMAMPMTFAIDGNGTWSMTTLNPGSGQFMEVAPGVPTVLTPGYAHIMLMNLTAPLSVGMIVPVELKFQNNGSGTVAVRVGTSP